MDLVQVVAFDKKLTGNEVHGGFYLFLFFLCPFLASLCELNVRGCM